MAAKKQTYAIPLKLDEHFARDTVFKDPFAAPFKVCCSKVATRNSGFCSMKILEALGFSFAVISL